jgi:hypothetical protein
LGNRAARSVVLFSACASVSGSRRRGASGDSLIALARVCGTQVVESAQRVQRGCALPHVIGVIAPLQICLICRYQVWCRTPVVGGSFQGVHPSFRNRNPPIHFLPASSLRAGRNVDGAMLRCLAKRLSSIQQRSFPEPQSEVARERRDESDMTFALTIELLDRPIDSGPIKWSIPGTSVTVYTGDMGNTFGSKGLTALSSRHVS